MRDARIKIDSVVGEAVYHCISRAVARQRLFDARANDVFRRQLWAAADFSGVQVITYALLSNHFHVVIRVPRRVPLSDEELLRRYQRLHPRPTERVRSTLACLRAKLAANGPEAGVWRRKIQARMYDVSEFMKTWKQGFTLWFNPTHNRIGTLWASRFTSVLLEPMGFAAEAISAYVDLNAVRAGIVRDPKDYHFCGYAEAVSGQTSARTGLSSLYGTTSWQETHARYRQTLFGIGADAREGKAAISYEDFIRVVREKGRLPLSDVMLCRLRHFVHGGILGTRGFVQQQFEAYVKRTRPRPRTVPRALPPWANWGDLCTMHKVRERDVA